MAWTAAKRKAAATKAQAIGEHLEDVVAGHLKRAEQARLVVWKEHNQPLFRQVGKGRFVRAAKSGADWSLVLNGGLAGALEVKGTQAPRFYRKEITDVQQLHLQEVAHTGGLSVLLVQFRHLAGWPIFRVPWRAVPWECASGKPGAASVTAESLAAWRFNQAGGIFDGLAVQCQTCGRVRLSLVVGQSLCLARCGA